MPAEQIHIVVDPQETTGALLERAAALPNGAAVRLEVPPGAVALRTLADFSRLRELAEAHRWQFTVASTDSAFLLRGRIYGLRTEMLSEEPAPPEPAGEAPADAMPTGPVAPPAPEHAPADLPPVAPGASHLLTPAAPPPASPTATLVRPPPSAVGSAPDKPNEARGRGRPARILVITAVGLMLVLLVLLVLLAGLRIGAVGFGGTTSGDEEAGPAIRTAAAAAEILSAAATQTAFVGLAGGPGRPSPSAGAQETQPAATATPLPSATPGARGRPSATPVGATNPAVPNPTNTAQPTRTPDLPAAPQQAP